MTDLPKAHYDSLAALEITYWWHLSRLNWTERTLRAYLHEPSSLRVLDYGCGTGGFLHELDRRMGFRGCLGVDTSSGAIDMAQRYGHRYSKIEPGDVSPANDMDVVLLMDVLEHIEADRQFLKRLFERMKPGAHVFITVPALPVLFSDWDRILRHFRRYTKVGLREVVRFGGGEIRDIRYVMSYLVLPLYVKRILLEEHYEEATCEFPPVIPMLNTSLILLNKLEMACGKLCSPPAGATLACLARKGLG